MQSEDPKVNQRGAEDWLTNHSDHLVCEDASYYAKRASREAKLMQGNIAPGGFKTKQTGVKVGKTNSIQELLQ